METVKNCLKATFNVLKNGTTILVKISSFLGALLLVVAISIDMLEGKKVAKQFVRHY